METQLAHKKGAQLSQFSGDIYCGQTAGWIKMALGMEVGLGAGHIVLDVVVDPTPLPKNGYSPQFSAHFYCGQTAACIKMPLCMEVGLSPGHIVLDRNPAPPPRKGGTAPNFRSMSIVTKRLDESRWHLAWR